MRANKDNHFIMSLHTWHAGACSLFARAHELLGSALDTYVESVDRLKPPPFVVDTHAI